MRLSFRNENSNRRNGARPLSGPEAAGAALAERRLQEFVDAMAALGNPGAGSHGAWPNLCQGWVLDPEMDPSVIVGTDGHVYTARDARGRQREKRPASEYLFGEASAISPTYRALDFARQLAEILALHGAIVVETIKADESDRVAEIEQELHAWTTETQTETDPVDPLTAVIEEVLDDVIDVTESSFLDEAPVVEFEPTKPAERRAEVTRERTGQIIEAVLVVLAGHPDGLSATEAIALVEKRLTLTTFECSEYPNNPGVRRFDKIVKFSTIPPRKAGWINVVAGVWTITADGTAMIGRYGDPGDLAREAARLYREWKKAPRTNNETETETDAETATGTEADADADIDVDTDFYGEADIASLAENEAEAATLAEISRLIERLHLISRSSD